MHETVVQMCDQILWSAKSRTKRTVEKVSGIARQPERLEGARPGRLSKLESFSG